MVRKVILIWIAFLLILNSFVPVKSTNKSNKKLIINSFKSFENFCRLYPLNRNCMGAFASGGKRSFDTNMLEKLLK